MENYVKVNPEQGSNNKQVNVTLQENKTDEDRTTTINIQQGTKTKQVTITQKKDDAMIYTLTGKMDTTSPTGNVTDPVLYKGNSVVANTFSDIQSTLSEMIEHGDVNVTIVLSMTSTEDSSTSYEQVLLFSKELSTYNVNLITKNLSYKILNSSIIYDTNS